MKRFAVTAAFVAGAFVLTGCNETSPSDGDVTNQQVDVPEIEIDIDGHTKTKTVQVPPPAVPKPQPPRVQPPAPVKPAPVAPPAVRPPAPAKR